ncbi:MAG: T9SS type A sorting domain-containing protein [Flavobacteriales bacterium]|nr:T9SS type A sorting domain-containing protein [Flavobacteriales bacterium]
MTNDENAFVNTTDIGISKLDIYQTTYRQSTFDESYFTITIAANALLVNYGPNTLDSCLISSLFHPGYYCYAVYFSEKFTDLNLAPGDSVWLDLGMYYEQYTRFTDTIFANTCLYTSHPNGVTDLKVDNDEYCESVLFQIIGIIEVELNQVSISPNPTQKGITIDLGAKVKDFTINVYSLEGKLVSSTNANNIDRTSLILMNQVGFISSN